MDKTTPLADLRGQLENAEGYVRGAMNKAKDALDKIHGIRMAGYLDPQPAPGPVDLGEWNKWKLWWNGEGAGASQTKFAAVYYWSPGASLNASGPEFVNALLSAYRRAVARGLATIPDGWDWLMWPKSCDWWPEAEWGVREVFLGVNSDGTQCSWPKPPERTAAESARRAAMLGLCEAKPAPYIVNAVPPPPGPGVLDDTKARLERAGATRVRDGHDLGDTGEVNAYTLKNGKVSLYFAQLPIPRAEAALAAATGKDCRECADFGKLTVRDEKLAAANAALEQAKREMDLARNDAAKLRQIVRERDAEIARLRQCCADQTSQVVDAKTEAVRLRGEIAAIEGHLNKGHFTLVDRWLARNAGGR